jgi:hypothetical protein
MAIPTCASTAGPDPSPPASGACSELLDADPEAQYDRAEELFRSRNRYGAVTRERVQEFLDELVSVCEQVPGGPLSAAANLAMEVVQPHPVRVRGPYVDAMPEELQALPCYEWVGFDPSERSRLASAALNAARTVDGLGPTNSTTLVDSFESLLSRCWEMRETRETPMGEVAASVYSDARERFGQPTVGVG